MEINREDYLGYKGYGIHKGSRNVKIAKLRKMKTTKKIEHEKLATGRRDIKHLNEFINHAEKKSIHLNYSM